MKDKLLKQWKKDVEDYGDNAYLMWTIKDKTFSSNIGVVVLLKSENYGVLKEIKRKQSAELPFDLERAESGDAIQRVLEIPARYFDVQFIREAKSLPNYIVISDKTRTTIMHSEYICMKYPPKVKK